MEVTFGNPDGMYVDIYSQYLDDIGEYGTELTDLFISDDGWNPYGSEPYSGDDSSNGEQWEYALVMDNHNPGSSTSGTLSLYKITDRSQIILSHDNPGYIFRNGQEVQLDTSASGLPSSIATGTWLIDRGSSASDSDDFLRFKVDYDFNADSGILGFHYASATCANDVIEGSAPVPEPATMMLFGVGLIGLAVVGRKKFI